MPPSTLKRFPIGSGSANAVTFLNQIILSIFRKSNLRSCFLFSIREWGLFKLIQDFSYSVTTIFRHVSTANFCVLLYVICIYLSQQLGYFNHLDIKKLGRPWRASLTVRLVKPAPKDPAHKIFSPTERLEHFIFNARLIDAFHCPFLVISMPSTGSLWRKLSH